MPRLRRQARQRRARPQLAAGVWEYLQGKKTYEKLDEGTKWDLLLLEGNVVNQWIPPDGPPNRVERFWDRIVAAVEAGDIEVSPEKKHCVGDQPLIPMTGS
jgi:hypothetical protein